MMIQSGHIRLRRLHQDDADWVLRLNNDALWQRFIGDRGVTDLDSAKQYIMQCNKSWETNGFGLLAVEDTEHDQAFGMCGFVTRDSFDWPDLGFALLPEARGKGIIKGAVKALCAWACENKLSSRITAMTHLDNKASQRILISAGFTRIGTICHNGKQEYLYWRDLPEE